MPNSDVTEQQEQRGRPTGYDDEFWLQAERELKGEGASRGVSPNATNAKSGGGSDGRSS
jgi:hypothetical protein